MSKTKQAFGLVVAIAICFGAAAIGGAATAPQIPNWYADLAKPSWTPPDWIFGPVWSALYLMMAVAAWLVWRQRGLAAAWRPLLLFLLQLVLNSLWSIAFFGLQNPAAAAVEIVWLWVAILLTMLAFWPRSAAAGALLLPYLAWVSFAAVLNFEIWRLNA